MANFVVETPGERRGSWLAFLLLFLWLLVVGVALWQRAQAAAQPPAYDAATYFQKARNVWAGLRARPVVNPFNAPPTVRPPGTVLVTGPFGFNPDFRGFYFRSVFLPIVAFALALHIAAWTRTLGRWGQWDLVFATIFLTAWPMFYHLEPVEGVYWPQHWGLVDSFLSGIAAIGAAAILRSPRYVSAAFLIVGAVAGALCVSIKPAGLLILILLAAAWLYLMLVALRNEELSVRKHKFQTLFYFGLFLFGGVFAAVWLACYRTEYFSGQNIQFGKTAVQLLKQESVYPYFPLFTKIRSTFGYATFVSLGILFLFMVASPRRAKSGFQRADVVVRRGCFVGLLYLAVGGWFWWVSTGGDILRYFFPFTLMAVVTFMPAVLETLSVMPFPWRVLLWGVWLIPAMGLLVLLLRTSPAPQWERAWGINLSSGEYGAEVHQAQQLVQELRSAKRDAFVYSFASGQATSAFESVSTFESTVHPDQKNFYVRLPVDWQNIPAYDVDGIVNSDYVLFSPIQDHGQAQAALGQRTVSSYADQKLIFNAWFSGLTQQDGVLMKSETKHNRLLDVRDPVNLEESLNRLRQSHVWSSDFRNANSDHWLSEQTFETLMKQNLPLARNINFGSFYRLDALGIEREGSDLKVNVWWEPPKTEAGPDCFFFIHLLDAKGAIIGNAQFMVSGKVYHPAGRNVRLDSVHYPLALSSQAVALGIGMYFPEGGYVMPDEGTRDWGGRRVLIPLTKSP
jgi:hypothetical protein